MYEHNKFVENYTYEGLLLALVVRGGFNEKGVHFFTPDNLGQQLAFMRHERGHDIPAHLHVPEPKKIYQTIEVLVIRKGMIRVDLYAPDQRYHDSFIGKACDVILLANGGHGFKILEDLEMFEIKQGPYAGLNDKIKFSGVNSKTS